MKTFQVGDTVKFKEPRAGYKAPEGFPLGNMIGKVYKVEGDIAFVDFVTRVSLLSRQVGNGNSRWRV